MTSNDRSELEEARLRLEVTREAYARALAEKISTGAWLWKDPTQRLDEHNRRAFELRERRLEAARSRHQSARALHRQVSTQRGPNHPETRKAKQRLEEAELRLAAEQSAAEVEFERARLTNRDDMQSSDAVARTNFDRARAQSRVAADAYRAARQRCQQLGDEDGRRPDAPLDPERRFLALIDDRGEHPREIVEFRRQRVAFLARGDDAFERGQALPIKISLDGEPPAPAVLAVVSIERSLARGDGVVRGYFLRRAHRGVASSARVEEMPELLLDLIEREGR